MKQYASGPVMPTTLKNFARVIVDASVTGTRVEHISSGIYNFITIFNNTRFDFNIYEGSIVNPLNLVGSCPAYTLVTFPHDTDVSNVLIEHIGVSGPAERCKIYFTEENLGLVGEFRAPQLALGAANNVSFIVFPAVARSISHQSLIYNNLHASGIFVFTNIIEMTGLPSIRIQILGEIGGTTFLLLESALLSALGLNTLIIYPGLDAAANIVANGLLPVNWLVRVVHTNTDLITYRVDVNVML